MKPIVKVWLSLPYCNDISTANRGDNQFCTVTEDAPSGLNLCAYRAYNPSLGRWISRDPDEEDDGTNLYVYVDNDRVP